jgi:hypothetical protein
VSLTLRIPRDLHTQLERYADSRGRSVNGQVVYWLRWFLEEASAGRDPRP